jgi:hypothetical protein
MLDVAVIAQNLARNCGYAVFRCTESKKPMLKRWPELASAIPDRISELWCQYPGPLIGIATGEPSGVSVLDIDSKHVPAVAWWRQNYARILPTRTYETRSGGLHLYFTHQTGVRNTQGKICAGVDTRGQGGYVIQWFAAGYGCHDHTKPVPWPAWLLSELAVPGGTGSSNGRRPAGDGAVAGIVRCVALAAEGERNAVLFWAACRLAERHLRQREIEVLLLPASIEAGLTGIEACRTISSAVAKASP